MKLSILAVAAVVSLATAQNLSGEPACATACLVSAISVAGCKPTDVACQCGTGQPAIQTAVTPCLVSNCNATDLNEAAQVGFALCSVYSAGLNSTTTTSGNSSVASTSSPLSTSTTSVTAVTTSVPLSSSSHATTTSASAHGSSSSSAPASSSSTGAAPGLVAGVGGVVGMMALVAAL